MRKATKLYALLGVLLVVCAAAFAVSRYEEKKEQIKTSGDVILEIPTDSVTALSWTNDSGTFSFTKGETWLYDEDNAFPVDGEKINDLLSQFASFTAAFAIDDVEDYAQYGLDEPVCTIHIAAGEESYTVELGGFSKMDEQRYLSIGDGKVYLVSHDPLDEFDTVLPDLILDDSGGILDGTAHVDRLEMAFKNHLRRAVIKGGLLDVVVVYRDGAGLSVPVHLVAQRLGDQPQGDHQHIALAVGLTRQRADIQLLFLQADLNGAGPLAGQRFLCKGGKRERKEAAGTQ